MLIMNFLNPDTNEQPSGTTQHQAGQAPTDWLISSSQDAPFPFTRIHSKGLKNVTEVPSIDAVTEQFIAGGGSIARPEMYIPGVGSLISCRDCAGHLFSFFESETLVRPEHITGLD